jgi:hypothetical protein
VLKEFTEHYDRLRINQQSGLSNEILLIESQKWPQTYNALLSNYTKFGQIPVDFKFLTFLALCMKSPLPEYRPPINRLFWINYLLSLATNPYPILSGLLTNSTRFSIPCSQHTIDLSPQTQTHLSYQELCESLIILEKTSRFDIIQKECVELTSLQDEFHPNRVSLKRYSFFASSFDIEPRSSINSSRPSVSENFQGIAELSHLSFSFDPFK